jgi:hypothetical protein
LARASAQVMIMNIQPAARPPSSPPGADAARPAKRVYVGNLPPDIDGARGRYYN